MNSRIWEAAIITCKQYDLRIPYNSCSLLIFWKQLRSRNNTLHCFQFTWNAMKLSLILLYHIFDIFKYCDSFARGIIWYHLNLDHSFSSLKCQNSQFTHYSTRNIVEGPLIKEVQFPNRPGICSQVNLVT